MNGINLMHNKVIINSDNFSTNSDGNPLIATSGMSNEEIERLSHLRVGAANGIIFDDRDVKMREFVQALS